MNNVMRFILLVLVYGVGSSADAASSRSEGSQSPISPASRRAYPHRFASGTNLAPGMTWAEARMIEQVNNFVESYGDQIGNAFDKSSENFSKALACLLNIDRKAGFVAIVKIENNLGFWDRIFSERKWGHLKVMIDLNVPGLREHATEYVASRNLIEVLPFNLLMNAGLGDLILKNGAILNAMLDDDMYRDA